MPQLKEILEKENQRDSLEQCAVIHLFKEGTFYRAYEWSAWLSVCYFTELKVTRRLLKGGEDIVFVGFPLTNLERYTPANSNVKPYGDACVDLLLSFPVFPSDASIESLQSSFANWKQSQPLTEASKKKQQEEKAIADRNTHPRLTDVMLRILSYPVEQHSPMECFEADWENNLEVLCDEPYTRTYFPKPSTCFIITDPKKREVFAADFRDRIVHHLYYNYTHTLYERTFIADSYSCIKGRGTHYGIERLQKHIRKESQGYTVPCYAMSILMFWINT